MKKRNVIFIYFLLISLSLFSQNTSITIDSDAPLINGMIINGTDTFAVVDISYIKDANVKFVERDYYKSFSDSLILININKDELIKDLVKKNEHLLETKELSVEISKLFEEQSDDCIDKYEDLSKKYKRQRKINKLLGATNGVTIIIILVALL